MERFALTMLAGAGMLVATNAFAGDALVQSGVYTPADNPVLTDVRLVCNDAGRCYRTRDSRRVVVREYGDSYNYAPRERYIERRGYYDDGPRVGVGIGPAGVGIGVDAGRW